MKNIFIDTSFLIALEAADDQNHKIALKYWHKLLKSNPSFISSTYILDEVVTFFNCHNKHAKAVDIGESLITSCFVKLIHIDENNFYDGWEYFKTYNDKLYSFTDCISFMIMKNLNINEALTFDKHFTQAGFIKLP